MKSHNYLCIVGLLLIFGGREAAARNGGGLGDGPRKPLRYEDFPPLVEGEEFRQRNEGG